MLPYRIHSYGGTYKASDNFPVKKISLLFLQGHHGCVNSAVYRCYLVYVW